MTTRFRTTLLMALLALGSACSKPGINAGEKGGHAFISFTAMLLITAAILWFFLGRER
jgi:hypothetical protein